MHRSAGLRLSDAQCLLVSMVHIPVGLSTSPHSACRKKLVATATPVPVRSLFLEWDLALRRP